MQLNAAKRQLHLKSSSTCPVLLCWSLKTDSVELDLRHSREGNRRVLQPITARRSQSEESELDFAQSSQRIHSNNNTEIKMAKPDPYADIDFEEINEATNLAPDEIKCLKV